MGTVLVIESERAMRTLACRLLQEGGYKVLSASSQTEALVLARHSGYCVDVLLSSPADAHIAQRLANAQRTPQVLVALEARDGCPPHHQATTKPFTRETLLRSVRQLLEVAPPSH